MMAIRACPPQDLYERWYVTNALLAVRPDLADSNFRLYGIYFPFDGKYNSFTGDFRAPLDSETYRFIGLTCSVQDSSAYAIYLIEGEVSGDIWDHSLPSDRTNAVVVEYTKLRVELPPLNQQVTEYPHPRYWPPAHERIGSYLNMEEKFACPVSSQKSSEAEKSD